MTKATGPHERQHPIRGTETRPKSRNQDIRVEDDARRHSGIICDTREKAVAAAVPSAPNAPRLTRGRSTLHAAAGCSRCQAPRRFALILGKNRPVRSMYAR